ncbi:MAG: Gp138 family membrane-puncturing spike protein [Acidobacteriaceae bacterium]
MPILADVPIFLPSAGGFTLTMPIMPGDECEVVFSDMDFQA